MTQQSDPGWKHRRRMAYGALAGGLLFPVLVFFNKDLAGISIAFYGFVGIVIGGYIGFATTENKWKGKE